MYLSFVKIRSQVSTESIVKRNICKIDAVVMGGGQETPTRHQDNVCAYVDNYR